MLSQSYEHGAMHIREGLPYEQELVRYIRDLGFLGVAESCRINVSSQRKRHRLYLFPFEAAGARVVLKVDTVDHRYSRLRQIELRLAGLMRAGLEQSFRGALALEHAGIPSIRPLAHWTYKPSRWTRNSYFLYEAVETDLSLKSYRDAVAAEPTLPRLQTFQQLIAMMADTTRKLHDAGLRHGDVVTGNFLVTGHAWDAAGELVLGEGARLHLIDTDHIYQTRWTGALKRFFDWHCLRRLDFDDEGTLFFLSRYCGRQISRIPMALRFWERGGFKPSHWIKRRGKKMYSKLQPRSWGAELLP